MNWGSRWPESVGRLTLSSRSRTRSVIPWPFITVGGAVGCFHPCGPVPTLGRILRMSLQRSSYLTGFELREPNGLGS